MTNLNALLEQIYHSTSPEFEPLRSLIQEKALLDDGSLNLKDATSAFLLHEWAELILKQCAKSYRLAKINYEQFSSLAIPLIQLRAHIYKKITSGRFPTLTLDEVMKIVAINYSFNEVDTLKKDLDKIYLAVSGETTAEEIRQYVNRTMTATAINRNPNRTSMQNVSEKMVNLRESFLEIPLISRCERNVFYSFLLGFVIREIYPELVKDAREDSVSKVKKLCLVLMFAYQIGSLTFSVDEIEKENIFDVIVNGSVSKDFYAITVNNAATAEQPSGSENSDITLDKESVNFFLVLYAFVFDSESYSIRKRFLLEIPGETNGFREKMSPAQIAQLKKLSFLLLGGVSAIVLMAIVMKYMGVKAFMYENADSNVMSLNVDINNVCRTIYNETGVYINPPYNNTVTLGSWTPAYQFGNNLAGCQYFLNYTQICLDLCCLYVASCYEQIAPLVSSYNDSCPKLVDNYLPFTENIGFGLGSVAACIALISALLVLVVSMVRTVHIFFNDRDLSSIHRLKELIGTWARKFPENTVITEVTSYLGENPSPAAEHSANNLEKWFGNVLIHTEIQAATPLHIIVDMVETADGIELAPMPSASSTALVPV